MTALQPETNAEAPSIQRTLYVECRECSACGHVGINDQHPTDAACGDECGWSAPSPVEDKCPGCEREGVMSVACPKCSSHYSIVAETHIENPVFDGLAIPDSVLVDLFYAAQGDITQFRVKARAILVSATGATS